MMLYIQNSFIKCQITANLSIYLGMLSFQKLNVEYELLTTKVPDCYNCNIKHHETSTKAKYVVILLNVLVKMVFE